MQAVADRVAGDGAVDGYIWEFMRLLGPGRAGGIVWFAWQLFDAFGRENGHRRSLMPR